MVLQSPKWRIRLNHLNIKSLGNYSGIHPSLITGGGGVEGGHKNDCWKDKLQDTAGDVYSRSEATCGFIVFYDRRNRYRIVWKWLLVEFIAINIILMHVIREHNFWIIITLLYECINDCRVVFLYSLDDGNNLWCLIVTKYNAIK